jgi:hypothetical protein
MEQMERFKKISIALIIVVLIVGLDTEPRGHEGHR